MMQSAVNYLRGWARLRVSGAFPERLLNLCAQQGLMFWAVEWLDGQNLRLTMLRRDLARLTPLAGRTGCSVEVEQQTGLPEFLSHFRRRYAFLIGLCLSVLLVCVGSGFVLSIEVTGNEQVPTAVILSQLRREGLRPGVYGPGLDTKQIALNTRLALEELSWVSVNLSGIRVQVVVREKISPPPLEGQQTEGDMLARAGGLVLKVETVSGQAQVKPGDMVAPGDVLISGTVTMNGPEYSDVPPRYLHVRAEGRVQARTWRTVQACIPMEATVKSYTGRERTRWSLTFFERRINFFGNSSISWSHYDKINQTHRLVLPGGLQLPIFLNAERLSQWQPACLQVDIDAAQELLERRLTAWLEEQVGPDGSVDQVRWTARIADGLLTVTGVAECTEQIADNTAGIPAG